MPDRNAGLHRRRQLEPHCSVLCRYPPILILPYGITYNNLISLLLLFIEGFREYSQVEPEKYGIINATDSHL